MKRITSILTAAALIVAGCVYDIPIADEQNIAVDPSVLGHWEFIPDETDSSEKTQGMKVLKYTESEYLIHYPTGEDGMYFRGYPIKIGDTSCVQLQLIGSAKERVDETDRKYHVVSYSRTGRDLVVKILNTHLVDDDIETSDHLRRAFLQHQDRDDLFANPGTFRKIR